MAAGIRHELGTDVDMLHGRYGEFKVLVDGKTVIDGGAKAIFGVVPSVSQIIAAVREHLSP